MKSSRYRDSFIILGLISFIAVGVIFYRSLSKDLDTSVARNISNKPISGSEQAIVTEYKNGTYSATGAYVSPGGPEEIDVKVVLKDDIIEDVEFSLSSPNPTTMFFVDKFQNGYKEFVIGKSINEVKLNHVAGSSLTPIGFNAAIEKIKAQAKS